MILSITRITTIATTTVRSGPFVVSGCQRHIEEVAGSVRHGQDTQDVRDQYLSDHRRTAAGDPSIHTTAVKLLIATVKGLSNTLT